MVGTFWSLIPPIIAVALALITKEVYSSLFVGIFIGALFYTNFAPLSALDVIIQKGFIEGIADKTTAGILVFLVTLGIMVAIINAAGGSYAFGTFAAKRCKTTRSAIFLTFIFGILLFVDDYFNCLTVGSVMRPVTDKQRVARAKLAYIIDATAAPICMIAPISSWAAAVSTTAKELNNDVSGIQLFCQAIPYNFYSIFTIFFIIILTVLNLDYGPMLLAQEQASNGKEPHALSDFSPTATDPKANLFDLLIPIFILIVFCITGMLYVGGFWSGASLIDAFANTTSAYALPWGAVFALVLTIIYATWRKVLTFEECMNCITKGFGTMIPAILVLTMAIALKNISNLLLASQYVATLMRGVSASVHNFLPAIIFVVGSALAFATGSSWGTFGVLIPIIVAMFPPENEMFIIGISACLAGAVCGDHCSPISDTTIMASAGSQCNHMAHVKTQLPYAITVAIVCFFTYIIAGFTQNVYISWAFGATLILLTLLMLNAYYGIKSYYA